MSSPWQRIAADPRLKKRWLGVRKQALILNGGRCEACGVDGARQVDHIDGTDYLNDSGRGNSWLSLGMVRLLCTVCHKRRTAKQGADARWNG